MTPNIKMASNSNDEDRISCNSKPEGSDDSDDSGNDPDSSVIHVVPAPSSQEIKCLKDQTGFIFRHLSNLSNGLRRILFFHYLLQMPFEP